MAWLRNFPPDLRGRLEAVMGYRSFGRAEIWDTVRGWLVAQGVDAPARTPLLTERLNGMGVTMSKGSVASMISRGGFRAAFFLRRLEAICENTEAPHA